MVVLGKSMYDVDKVHTAGPTDLEVDVKKSDDQPPKDSGTSPASTKARFRHVGINTALVLATTTVISPMLVFIVLPHLFIITGQRARTKESFWQAFWIGTALSDILFFFYTFRRYRRGDTFLEASTATLCGLFRWFVVLIFAYFIFRVYYPVVYNAGVWLRGILMWIWGG